MEKRRQKIVFIGSAAALIVLLASVYIFKATLVGEGEKRPSVVLEPGWQFYDKPTSLELEPPGTIFRIDRGHARFVVDVIAIPMTSGAEVYGKSVQTIRTNAKALSRIIGKQLDASVDQEGNRVETLEFEMLDVQREVTTDLAIKAKLEDFRSKGEFKRDNRYFIIREARSAKALRYSLSEQLVNGLGGSSSLSTFVKTQAGLSYEKQGSFILSQDLPVRMRVMFLAEEIVPVSSGFSNGKPELDTIPVTEPLLWE